MMFAVYFVKDQAVAGAWDAGGHRHDWEWGLMWTTNNQLTHASNGYHATVKTRRIDDLFPDNTPEQKLQQKFVYMRYYKSGGGTHTVGLFDAAWAKNREDKKEIENPTGHWYKPSVVDWDKLPCNIKNIFNEHDYGTAKMPMNRSWFSKNIERTLPEKGKPGVSEGAIFAA